MVLRYRAAKGLFWHFFGTISWKAIEFLSTIILARILVPEEFGIMAICYLILYFIYIFANFGISGFIIQKKDVKKDEINTAFFATIGFSLLVYIIVFLLSPFLEKFYDVQGLSLMIRTLSLSIVITSFGSIPATLEEKHLNFKQLYLPKVFPWFMQLLSATVLALMGYGVWSLIYGYLIMNIVGLVMIWIISPYRPEFKLDEAFLKECLNYGKDVMQYAIISFLLFYGIEGYVGKFFGTVLLGYFTVANKFATLMSKNITQILNKVIFSTFSKIQDDLEEVSESFVKLIEYASLIIIPGMIGIIFLAPEIITILYTSKWTRAISVLKILSVSGLVMSLANITNSVYFAIKKQKILLRIQLIQIIILSILIIPLSNKYNLEGVAIALLISFAIKFILGYYGLQKLLGFDALDVLKRLSYIPLASILMGMSVLVLKIYIDITNIVLLLFAAGFGFVIFLVLVFITNKDIYKRIIKFYFNFKKNS